jgi:exopolyphosphatase/guanosine-5'-triphosphate,3'-diphosphate pyrophosphatase
MKLAAIDLGSNSFHMVIVEVSASGAFEVIDREKERVRLGAETLSRGQLPAAAMRRGLAALAEFKRLADSHGVEKLLAVATSAIREATNGEDFLERAGRETGIWPRAVSGEEEARLIYLAALHSVHLGGQRALLVDIGGGSVELAVGVGEELLYAASEKLGVLRLAERLEPSDPLSRRDEKRIEAAVDELVAPHLPRLRGVGFDVAVGTSGTILALGAYALTLDGGAAPEPLHHASVDAAALHEVRRRLLGTAARERERLAGLDASRADTIVVGAIVLDTLLARLGAERLTLCDWALREGLLLDYIHGHRRSLARAESYPDPRRRSVVHLAERCQYDAVHARHVSELALALFDGTHPHHGLGRVEREWLEFAGLLHDIGHHISYPGHHRHAHYLIQNGDLKGFRPEEVEVIANVARYHRRGLPSKKHAPFRALPKPLRRTVRVLAGFLRAADALDRSHRQVIRRLAFTERNGALRLRCEAVGDCQLELWGVPRRLDLMQQALGVAIRVEARPLEGAAAAAERSA